MALASCPAFREAAAEFARERDQGRLEAVAGPLLGHNLGHLEEGRAPGVEHGSRTW